MEFVETSNVALACVPGQLKLTRCLLISSTLTLLNIILLPSLRMQAVLFAWMILLPKRIIFEFFHVVMVSVVFV
jgi:hypothetical protein